jgi:uncharacterized protein
MARSTSQTTFVDAHFVVALVNRRDRHHVAAVELSNEYVGRQLFTTDAVLIEIGNALARNFRAEAAEVIEYFYKAENIEIVRLTTSLFDEAFSLYRDRDDKTWGMTDCISFAVMRQLGVQDALTHDQHFTQAGFTALLRVE